MNQLVVFVDLKVGVRPLRWRAVLEMEISHELCQ